MTSPSEDEVYQRARARAGAVEAFYYGLGAYVVVNVVLFLINWFSGGPWWFYWVTLFWGIGMIAWGWGTFSGNSGMLRKGHTRRVERYAEEERRAAGENGPAPPPDNPVS